MLNNLSNLYYTTTLTSTIAMNTTSTTTSTSTKTTSLNPELADLDLLVLSSLLQTDQDSETISPTLPRVEDMEQDVMVAGIFDDFKERMPYLNAFKRVELIMQILGMHPYVLYPTTNGQRQYARVYITTFQTLMTVTMHTDILPLLETTEFQDFAYRVISSLDVARDSVLGLLPQQTQQDRIPSHYPRPTRPTTIDLSTSAIMEVLVPILSIDPNAIFSSNLDASPVVALVSKLQDSTITSTTHF